MPQDQMNKMIAIAKKKFRSDPCDWKNRRISETINLDALQRWKCGSEYLERRQMKRHTVLAPFGLIIKDRFGISASVIFIWWSNIQNNTVVCWQCCLSPGSRQITTSDNYFIIDSCVSSPLGGRWSAVTLIGVSLEKKKKKSWYSVLILFFKL